MYIYISYNTYANIVPMTYTYRLENHSIPKC